LDTKSKIGAPEPFRGTERLLARTPNAGRSRRKLLVISLAIHVFLVAVFVVMLPRLERAPKPPRVDIVFYPRDAEPPPPAPPPRPEPEPVEVAKVEPPKPVAKPKPKPKPIPPEVEPPKPVARKRPPKPKPKPIAEPPPPAPRPKVRTDLFAEAAAKPAAPSKPPPPDKQTRKGSFGTAETAEPPASPAYRARGKASVGGFEVADSEPVKHDGNAARRAVASGNFGDTVAAAAPVGDGTRERTVKTASFGDDSVVAPSPGGRNTGSVKEGQFGDTVAVASKPEPRKKPAADPDSPVVILSKPKPLYTDEARQLKVEGEVVLDVVFVKSGQLRVLGVVSSLGYGLDEAAVEAAKQIDFKPAQRDGLPIDHKATLRIVFQLA